MLIHGNMEAQMTAIMQRMAQMETQLQQASQAVATADSRAQAAEARAQAAEGLANQAGATAQAAQAAATAAAAQAQSAPAPSRGSGLDTRTLGRPDSFNGDEKSWGDWSVVVRAYCGVVNPRMGDLLSVVERSGGDDQVRNAALTGDLAAASQHLYFILLMLCKGEPLNILVNSGVNEGGLGFRRLSQRYDASSKTHVAANFLELLNWDFKGDLVARLELFNRAVARHENRSGETLSAQLKVGLVINRLEDGNLRNHLVMNMERLNTWEAFTAEVQAVRRAQQGTQPMGLSEFSGHCPLCWLDPCACEPAALEALNKLKGKAKGKGGGGKAAAATTCHKCGKAGHWARDCRSGGSKGGGKTDGKPAGGGGQRAL